MPDTGLNPAGPPLDAPGTKPSTPAGFKDSILPSPAKKPRFEYKTYDDLPHIAHSQHEISGAKIAEMQKHHAEASRQAFQDYADLKVQGTGESRRRVKFSQTMGGEEGKSLNVQGEDEETKRLR